jgi:hypothetical protein
MTLQIAWAVSSAEHVLRFPDLERFMAYQAIVSRPRAQLLRRPSHAGRNACGCAAGWNWTFWERCFVRSCELTSDAIQPALLGAKANVTVAASVAGVELAARTSGSFLYVIAVRRGGTTSQVTLSGLPKQLTEGQVLLEYVQDPPPPPIEAGHQVFRRVAVRDGKLTDWFAPHDVHVYRFQA